MPHGHEAHMHLINNDLFTHSNCGECFDTLENLRFHTARQHKVCSAVIAKFQDNAGSDEETVDNTESDEDAGASTSGKSNKRQVYQYA
jgi:hypothetical protein